MKRFPLFERSGWISVFSVLLSLVFLSACASTTIIESPKTAFVPERGGPKTPELVWSSKTLPHKFDYLGEVHVKSWSYNGAVERLTDAGRQLRADALIDVHYEQVGFLTTLQAFAVKYK